MSISKKELLNVFEKLSSRIDMLSEQQKTFVRLFMSSQSFRRIAKTAGVHEATIARRLKRIAERIGNNDFIAVLSQNGNLTGEEMEVLKDRFVNGMAVKTIAENRKMTCYRVKKIIKENTGQKFEIRSTKSETNSKYQNSNVQNNLNVECGAAEGGICGCCQRRDEERTVLRSP